jgi:hypothetical protein
MKRNRTSFDHDDHITSNLCSVAAAVIGSAVVGGAMSADASRKAANASKDAAAQAAAQNDKANTRLQPYADAGLGASQRLQDGLKAGGEFEAPKYNEINPDNISQDKGYQFTLKSAMDALSAQRSVGGGALGSNEILAAQKQGAGIANTYLNDAVSRNLQQWQAKFNANQGNVNNLMGLTKTGEAAAAGQAATDSNTGQLLAAGTIGGSNANGTINAINGAINTGSAGLGLYQGLSKTGSLSGTSSTPSATAGGGLTLSDASKNNFFSSKGP